jgi:hypothetical protein
MRRALCVTDGCDGSTHQESRPCEPLTVYFNLLGMAAAVAHLPCLACASGSWPLEQSMYALIHTSVCPVLWAACVCGHAGVQGVQVLCACGVARRCIVGHTPALLVAAVQPCGRSPPVWGGAGCRCGRASQHLPGSSSPPKSSHLALSPVSGSLQWTLRASVCQPCARRRWQLAAGCPGGIERCKHGQLNFPHGQRWSAAA